MFRGSLSPTSLLTLIERAGVLTKLVEFIPTVDQ